MNTCYCTRLPEPHERRMSCASMPVPTWEQAADYAHERVDHYMTHLWPVGAYELEEIIIAAFEAGTKVRR